MSSRVKNIMLRGYYDDPEPPTVIQPSSNPLDLDGPAFDEKTYLAHLLKNKALPELIRTDNEIISEIKRLDSDMKTLVYENYNKFISATDTIQKMKDNVIGMEDKMKELEINLEKICKTNNQVDSTMSAKREKIEELSTISRILKKRQFLFELPSTLRKCIESGSLTQAAKYYNATANILNKYLHLPSFLSIKQESDKIISGLRTQLSQLINSNQSNRTLYPELTYIDLISVSIDLNEGPDDIVNIRTSFFTWWEGEFSKKMATWKADHHQSTILKSTQDQDQDILPTRILGLGSEFLKETQSLQDIFSSLFIYRPILPKKSIPESKNELNDFIEKLITLYLSLVQSFLMDSQDSQVILQTLGNLHSNMLEIRSHFRHLSLERLDDVIINTVTHSINGSFNQLKNSVVENLKKESATHLVSSKNGLQEDLGSRAHSLFTQVLSEIELFLKCLRPFLNFQEKGRGFLERYSTEFLDKIGIKIQQFLLGLSLFWENQDATHNENFLDSKDLGQPKMLLVLARVCQQIEREGFSKIQQLLTDLGGSHNQSEFIRNRRDLVNQYKNSAKALLLEYVKLHGQNISNMIRKGIETPDWLDPRIREPRDVRLANIIISEVEAANSEISQIFTDQTERPLLEPPSERGRNNRGRGRLYEKKSSSEIAFNRISIIAFVIQHLLKSFNECTRLKTFGKFGLQQIQVEVYYMRLNLHRYLDWNGRSAMDILLDEVLSSTAERCVDPSYMEHGIIVNICERKLREQETG